MNGTRPVDVRAEFFTGEPLGRMCERSCPTPPRRFMSCTCSSSTRMIPPYESAFPSMPITKQFDSEAIWKSFPIPVIGLPDGTIYLKWSRRSKISCALIGFLYCASTRAISFAIRQCISSGLFSYMLPKESLTAYLLTHTLAASSSPPK